MAINSELTKGCDKMSRVYGKMFNVLEEVMQDDEKLKELSPLDFSALGMYIGKFVEQEINSSVVQIMRKFRGVPMPQYYCKRCPSYIRNVGCLNKSISINARGYLDDSTSLKTISLGDAYYALEQLKTEDNNNFFAKYPWLSKKDFLNAWHQLYKFRNKMAHIGEIIDADILERNYDAFLTFLKYMPDINIAKRELAPKGYKQSLTPKKQTKGKRPYSSHINSDIASATRTYHQSVKTECYESLPKSERINFKAKIFKQRKGKKGLKGLDGNILVPANYDNFGFLPYLFDNNMRKSVIAVRDEKYYIVALDGSGKELTKEPYDEISLADSRKKNSPYVYRKNGRMLWGFMDESGNEVSENIIENYVCIKNSLWYERGELKGYWNYGESYPFLPPIFDNIETLGKPNNLLLFTLNGVDGYVEIIEDNFKFIPMTELDNLDGEGRSKTLESCISEE